MLNFGKKQSNGEMDSLDSNETWHLVDLLHGCKLIGCIWILGKELKPEGTVYEYKGPPCNQRF